MMLFHVKDGEVFGWRWDGCVCSWCVCFRMCWVLLCPCPFCLFQYGGAAEKIIEFKLAIFESLTVSLETGLQTVTVTGNRSFGNLIHRFPTEYPFECMYHAYDDIQSIIFVSSSCCCG